MSVVYVKIEWEKEGKLVKALLPIVCLRNSPTEQPTLADSDACYSSFRFFINSNGRSVLSSGTWPELKRKIEAFGVRRVVVPDGFDVERDYHGTDLMGHTISSLSWERVVQWDEIMDSRSKLNKPNECETGRDPTGLRRLRQRLREAREVVWQEDKWDAERKGE